MMSTLFRRNTTSSRPQREDEFSDYTAVISQENDPRQLKEYIGRLYKALKDKSRRLRTAEAKVEHVNAELELEKTRFHDIEDENRTLRDQMQQMADQLATREQEFKEWQERLVQQTEEERNRIEEDHEEMCVRYDNRVNVLEEALEAANDELATLTIRVRELIDGGSEDSRSSFSLESRYSDANKHVEDDRQVLTQQLLEITERRIGLQTEVSLLEEENDELRMRTKELEDEVTRLRTDKEGIRQQLGRRAFMKSLESVSLDD